MPQSPLEHLPEPVPGASPAFRMELAAQLAELVPEAVADGKIDVKKLAELLGDDTADESERFGLFWPGKKRALRAAQAPTSATLKPDFANSKDWDTTRNVFIEGDNLEVLKILQRHYHNKVKLIYIDPPYNTGKDFVYPDNFTEGMDTYLEWTRQVNEEGKKVSTNSETEGRYHSNWLNMMYPRLKLARNLLTDDGIIFISIDDNEVDNLIRLGKEVFGEPNYLGLITRATGTPTGGGFDGFTNMVDYMLVFRRSSDAVLNGLEFSENDAAIYNESDERGRYLIRSLRRTGGEDRRQDRPSMHYGIEAPDGSLVFPIGPSGYESRWICGQDRYRQMEKEGLIEWKQVERGNSLDWHPYQKFYLDGREKRPSNLWTDIEGNKKGTREVRQFFNGEKVFDSPKPVELIQRVIQVAANNDSLVIDFFAGSSTTAHAVMQLNAEDNCTRRFIMVQLPEPTPEDSEARKAGFATIADISRKRIELAGEKIGKGDTGFRAYKLTDTHFAKWRVTSEVTPTQLEQHLLDLRESADDDASQDDLLTELLLKLGLSLTETIVTKTIAGLDVREVDDNRVLAYVDESIKPTLEQLRALVDAAPGKVIVLEDAFQGDDQLKTNLAQYARTKGVELRTA